MPHSVPTFKPPVGLFRWLWVYPFETRTAITPSIRSVQPLSGIARDDEVIGIKGLVIAWNRMIIRRNDPQLLKG